MSQENVERNRALVLDLFAQVINAHDAELADRYYRADYIQHNPDVPQGLAGVKLLLTMLFEAFPDLHGKILLSLAEQDRVMALVEWTGTQRGAFLGIPASGKPVQFRSAEIFRIEAGKCAEHWDVVDNTNMQLTLGLLSRYRP